MYCKKCGKEIPDDSTFCKYCGAQQIDNNSAEQGKKQNYNADVSNNKGCLKRILKIVGVLLFFSAIIAYICFFYPLKNDEECYKAGKSAHEARKELNEFNAFHGSGDIDECPSTCPICHPNTWRWEVKKERMKVNTY